jgi:hypothetical protein
MLSSLFSKWMHEGSSRPLLGRWCHVAYNTSCDPIRKAEFNTNDHGLVLVHTKSDEKKETKKEETNDERSVGPSHVDHGLQWLRNVK